MSFTPDYIEAVASLWKLVAALVLLVIVYLFRKPLEALLDRLTRFRVRRGDAEIVAEGPVKGDESESDAEPVAEQVAEKGPERKSEETAAPQVDDPKEWFRNMLDAFKKRRFEEADRAFETLKRLRTDHNERIKDQATYFVCRFRYARDESAFDRLNSLSENKETRPYVLSSVAFCHEQSKDFKRAAEAYGRAIEAVSSDEDRARYTVSLAQCKMELSQTAEGLQVLLRALAEVSSPEAKATLYGGIASLEKALGNLEMRAVALEKVVEYKPGDTSARFDAAFALSEVRLSHLSAMNYDTLLRFHPENASALNNLGVECETLGMPVRSISFYREAVKHNLTLAMANLANRYLKEGLVEDAESLLEKAKQEKELHPNVGRAIAAASDKRTEEESRWETVLNIGVKQQQFLHSFADAYFLGGQATTPFAGDWSLSSGESLIITQDGEKISAEWEQDQLKRRLKGTARNRGAKVRIRKWESYSTGLGGRFVNPTTGYAYVDPNLSELRIMTVLEKELVVWWLSKKPKR